jgi:hypothetical protein
MIGEHKNTSKLFVPGLFKNLVNFYLVWQVDVTLYVSSD